MPPPSGGGDADELRSEGRSYIASSACACSAALTGACPTCGMRDIGKGNEPDEYDAEVKVEIDVVLLLTDDAVDDDDDVAGSAARS